MRILHAIHDDDGQRELFITSRHILLLFFESIFHLRRLKKLKLSQVFTNLAQSMLLLENNFATSASISALIKVESDFSCVHKNRIENEGILLSWWWNQFKVKCMSKLSQLCTIGHSWRLLMIIICLDIRWNVLAQLEFWLLFCETKKDYRIVLESPTIRVVFLEAKMRNLEWLKDSRQSQTKALVVIHTLDIISIHSIAKELIRWIKPWLNETYPMNNWIRHKLNVLCVNCC